MMKLLAGLWLAASVSAYGQQVLGGGITQGGGGGGGGTGTATSVGLAMPATFCGVTGSPVTTAGTLTCTYATGQTASLIFGTNASGNVGLMNLTAAQLPAGTVTSYPAAGVAVSTGSAWTTSLTAPVGALVGTTDTQTLTNKTIASTQITGLPTFPAGTIVGTTDTQTLTNKTIASTQITGLPTFPAGTIVGTTDTQTLTNKSIAATEITGLPRAIGATFDASGATLTAGKTVYFTVPFGCTINAWNMTVDAGTATVDIWKIATGTAIPTVANTIVASAAPAISTGTALHSTTLTSWTTTVTANDIFGINLKTVATATAVSLVLGCS